MDSGFDWDDEPTLWTFDWNDEPSLWTICGVAARDRSIAPTSSAEAGRGLGRIGEEEAKTSVALLSSKPRDLAFDLNCGDVVNDAGGGDGDVARGGASAARCCASAQK